jgi:hypothetical protein
MATGDEARVYQIMLDAVKDFAEKPENDLRTSIPNKDFTPTTFPYLDVQDFRADRNGQHLGPTKFVVGTFQVTVIDKRGTGILAAKEVASRLLDEFPMGRRLTDGTLCVQIVKQVNERPPIYEDTEIRIPVTIPYQCYITN